MEVDIIQTYWRIHMAIDNNGNVVYSTDDLIGFASLGSLGPKSRAVLGALQKLKYYEALVPVLQKQVADLSASIPVSGTVEEIVIGENKSKKK
jgi:hypothetical protein